jgi:hypothetical protein
MERPMEPLPNSSTQTISGGFQIPIIRDFPTDWLFYPTAHGKDDSDPDLGKCKSAGSKHQTTAAKCEVAKIYSAEEFYEFLKGKMQFPKKTFI